MVIEKRRLTKRFEAPRSIGIACLHELIGQATYLGGECADQVVTLGEEVNVEYDSQS